MKNKVIFMLFVTLFMGLNTPLSVSAASVGQTLPIPETSWQRIDDTDTRITYNGNFLKGTGNSVDYNGTAHWTDSANQGKYVEFSFVGTKLRLIYAKNNAGSSNVAVTIDGVTETYSAYSNSVTTDRFVLLYEKTGLSNTQHTVHIEAATTGTWGMDAIDIDSTGYMINTSLNSPSNLTATAGDANVSLQWIGNSAATYYNVKRSTSPVGPFVTIQQNVPVTRATYQDLTVTNSTTYYYVITSINSAGEGYYSNVVVATPQAPQKNRGLLTITMSTGLEKEYDLSMQEINAFISWYETKEAGTGTASYAINKYNTNKGPFKNRKDYVIFDKILTFEVNEYIPVE
ncbi:fibronectin type III domain-containing protein [Paenibacillus spiritus]|uniref:Fibronectin type III domain-containing protein n=1 Tax=Paenibacillus spiritus TaxID=2496557 RepID=A0A5J5G1G4_9BACL|nr:fibronectin type III domain-containing protein [Paenibacillus spiritus]KAA8999697.1 fibronectin type III domain-containing protein [Paenibacillus spiritus]